MSHQNAFSLSPRERNILMWLTAEMLALPQIACGNRDCRRAAACRYVSCDSGAPDCLGRLTATEREAFDRLFALVVKIADMIHVGMPSRDAGERALEEAAIEIICIARRKYPGLGFFFQPWLTQYRAAGSAHSEASA